MTPVTGTVVSPVRSRAGSYRQAATSLLRRLWDVYSAPAPAGGDVLVLLGLCVGLSVLTGGLLHRWLSATLRYGGGAAAAAACVHGVGLLLATFLCHPLRCVLTLTLPTVCTKQGRKLLVSAAVMALALNVIPNISANVGAAARILKCSAEGFTRTILNSSEPLNRVKRDLLAEAVRVKREDLSVVTHLRTLDHSTDVDVSQVRSGFLRLIGQIEAQIAHARNLLRDYKLLSNRVLAAVFVLLLVLESARYLKSYLTCVRFDNAAVGRLRRRLGAGEAKPARRKFPLRSCRATSEEVTSCLVSMIVVTLYFAAMASIVLTDHVVFYTVQMIVPWLQEFPPTSAVISVSYKVRWFPPAFCIIPQSCVTRELSDFQRDYRWDFNPEPSLCDAAPSPPSVAVALLLALLWAVSYFLVFVEVYAKRLRRKISASFFRKQEEKRVAYLMQKIRAKEGENGGSATFYVHVRESE